MTAKHPKPRVLSRGTVRTFAAVLAGTLIACAWLAPFNDSASIRYSLSLFGFSSLAALYTLRNREFSAEFILRKPHWVQFLMHSTVFVYWGMHYDEVARQVPFILLQVLMAYLLDILLSWWRRGRWVAGLGPIPVVGSINLFLWFRPEYWHWQVFMVVIAMASKPFLRWTRDGQNTHIFNPSAIALGLVSLFVIIQGGEATRTMTWGVDIATTLNNPEHIYICLFAVGLVVQLFFKTTLTTATAAVSLWAFSFIWALDPSGMATSMGDFLGSAFGVESGNGVIFRQTYIPIAVFLGMNLLITDPTTSPYSKSGRVLFGMGYGLAVVILWWWLEAIGQPTFYDKLLQVPILNLMVPLFDAVGRRLDTRLKADSLLGHNLVHVGLWTTAFFFMLPTLKPQNFQEEHRALMAKFLDDSVVDGAAYRLKEKRGRAQQSLVTGYQFLEGRDGTPRNERDAATAFNDACKVASPEFSGEACYRLGELYLDGRLDQSGQGEPNVVAASAEFQRACELNYGPACGHLGTMYMAGEGVGQDQTRGVAFLERGCELGAEAACTLVQKAKKAKSQPTDIRSACEKGNAQSCYILAGQHFNAREIEQAAIYAEKACLGGIAEMCGNVGGLFLEGKGVPRDVTKGKAYIQRACEGGIQRACDYLKQIP